MALFLHGEVADALTILDDNKLQESLTEARKTKQEAQKAETESFAPPSGSITVGNKAVSVDPEGTWHINSVQSRTAPRA
jgi:hypothetical protein